MSKCCMKCGREIPHSSKKDLCESCQHKWFAKVRKVGGGVLSLVLSVGGVALMIATKGKIGGPRT